MKNKFTRRQMKKYYSEDELKRSISVPPGRALRWLEEGRRFFSKAVPKSTKKLQGKLKSAGW